MYDRSLSDISDALLKQIFTKFKVLQLGIIDFYNAEQNVANVILTEDKQILKERPVLKSKHILFPISKGDLCVVLCADYDSDEYLETKNFGTIKVPLRHNLKDSFIIPFDHKTDIKKVFIEFTVDNKIKMANDIENLNSLLTEVNNTIQSSFVTLIATLQTLQVVDPVSGLNTISPQTIGSLNTVQNNINTKISALNIKINNLLSNV